MAGQSRRRNGRRPRVDSAPAPGQAELAWSQEWKDEADSDGTAPSSKPAKPAKTDTERARDIITRQLAMMDRSRKQLADALAARDIPEHVARQELDHFAELGLIDDAHFAEVLVRTRLAEKHASKRAIAMELRRKGVAVDIVECATEGIDEDSEYANAVVLAMKKLRIASGKPETLDRRVYAALARRGFSPGICSKALAEAKGRIEAGEDERDFDSASFGGSMFGYDTSLGI